VNGPAAGTVSPLLSGAMSRVSGHDSAACADRSPLLEDDLGIGSLALAELIGVISAKAGS
jgi:hypothetical protein